MEHLASHFLLLGIIVSTRTSVQKWVEFLYIPDTFDLILISNSSVDILTSGFGGTTGEAFGGWNSKSEQHNPQVRHCTMVSSMGAVAWDGVDSTACSTVKF